jgi:hypothetical protein
MHSTISNFILRTLLFLGMAFGLHIFINGKFGKPIFGNQIIFSYTLNLIYGLLVFSFLFLLRHKIKNHIGFTFILSGLVKLMLYFIFFYKPFMMDSILSKNEFITLFMPHILVLIIEVFSVSQWLNKIE